MMPLCPKHVCAGRWKVGGKCGTQWRYLQTSITFVESLVINRTSFILLIIEITYSLKDDQKILGDSFLMTTEATVGTDILPLHQR